MSSAILYLAIIAIWACVLVPRWIHKPHRVPEADELPGLKYVSASGQAASGGSRGSSASGNAPPAAWAAASAAMASAATATATAASASASASADADAGKAAEAPRYEAGGSGAGQPVAVEEGVAWHRVTRSYHSEHQVARPEPLQAPGRARILQARRRLLTTLVTLAVAALACAAVNLAPWWILVPPVGMLGMYVLLLREAAQADVEQERWLAKEQAAQAETARSRARQAWEASQPEPTAEIIDISARVTDQLYDQYADAAVRAVGD